MILYKEERIITPDYPIRLAGFAHRIGLSEGVKDNLRLKVIIMEQNNKRVMIVSADLLFWEDELISDFKLDVKNKLDINHENVLFTATHTHSGPLICKNMSSELGIYDEKYILFLKEQFNEIIDEILNKPINVKGYLQEDEYFYGINRRYIEKNKVLMKPNFKEEIDNDCKIIKLINEDGELECILINYALHANTTDINYINGDYPSLVCKEIESKYEKALCIFLQGFTGNIRPRMIVGEEFFRGTYDETIDISHQISKRLLKTIKNCKGQRIDFEISTSMVEKKLPMDYSIQNREVEFAKKFRSTYDEWLKIIESDKRKKEVLNVQSIKLSENIIFIGINGEVVDDYSRYIKKIYENINIFNIGYSNGMIGYLATKNQLKEGGYESDDFIYYFGIAGKYKGTIEKIIKSCMVEVIENSLKGD